MFILFNIAIAIPSSVFQSISDAHDSMLDRNNDNIDYLSDDVASNSSTANNVGVDRPGGVGRPSMTRSISGHSLGDLEFMQQQYDQQQQNQKNPVGNNRRTSAADVSGGKRNFRSKRFSRNIEREPAMRRAQSLHMDRSRGLDEDAFVDIRGGHQSKQHSSGSSGPEDTMHFTATVQSSQQ